jgi:hypothetical protein
MCRDIDAVEQCARLGGIEHRRLSAGDDVPRPAHRAGRVDRHDLTGDEPIEQMSDRGELLLTLGAASSRVPVSIQVATCTGCTAPIDGTPASAH